MMIESLSLAAECYCRSIGNRPVIISFGTDRSIIPRQSSGRDFDCVYSAESVIIEFRGVMVMMMMTERCGYFFLFALVSW